MFSTQFARLRQMLSTIVRTRPRTLYHAILLAGDSGPELGHCDNSMGRFCGIEGDFLFRALQQDRWHELHFADLARLLVKPGDNAIDLGANLGTHAIYLSRLTGEGQVFAFEPQSLTFSMLQSNLVANSCRNVVAYKFAASDRDFDIISMDPIFYGHGDVNNGRLRVSPVGGVGDKTITRTLDSLDLPRVDFMKIDIQGSEVRALKGATRILTEDRPHIFIEIEERHLRSLGTSSKELIELILAHNYCIYRIRTSYPCDHLCVPLEKDDAFRTEHRSRFDYELDEIRGRHVALTFARPGDQNYEKIEIID